jgi:hypothetical protein
VPGESQSPFARRGSDTEFWVPLYKYEKLQQQGSTCVSGTDSVAFLMSRTRTDRQTDVHTKHFLTVFHKISYCKIQTARWVDGGCDVSINGSRRWVKPISVTQFSFLYLNSVH